MFSNVFRFGLRHKHRIHQGREYDATETEDGNGNSTNRMGYAPRDENTYDVTAAMGYKKVLALGVSRHPHNVTLPTSYPPATASSYSITLPVGMVEYVSKAAGKKLFERHLEQYAPPDPLYEIYTNDRGKQKRRQRELPPGLSKRDARILKSVKRRAHYLDKGFSFCGFRCGWTFVIGLVPVAGDIANLSLNHLLVVRKAKQADVPAWLIRKMQVNNVISTGAGFVPIAGDFVVAVFKANSRNCALLEEFLRIRGEEYLKLNTGSSGQPLNSAERQEKEKKGWAWYKKKGVSRRDAEQIKPGAGMVEGEVVPSNTNLVEEGVDGQNSGSSSRSGGSNNNRSALAKTTTDEKSSGPSKTRSGFSLFGRDRKATAPVGHAEAKERVTEKSRA